jgi:RNA polymerase sigma-70 factor (subfamily 1)
MTSADDQLLQAAAQGDRNALAALLKAYGPRVRQGLHIERTWQAMLDPADVMQVTYLEAFLHIGDLQARTPEAFEAWLTRLAQNNLRDGVKELRRLKRPSSRRQIQPRATSNSGISLLDQFCSAPGKSPSRDAASREARQLLTGALESLPQPYAEVLRLRDLEGQTVAEAATRLGRSPGAVCMLRVRAMQQLRALLGPESHFFSDGA